LKNDFELSCFEALIKEYGKSNVLYEPEEFLYTSEHIYTPDFRVRDGSTVFYVESKGYLRPDNRRTLCNVKTQHDLDLRLIFQRDQKTSKGAKQRYSDWAESKGFAYCIGVKNIKDILQ
jgi:predicted nuclease of restriction endonuclease-like RecB superfamily